MRLMPRDLELLETLACRVSAIRFSDLAQMYAPEGAKRAPRERMRRLARGGWFRLSEVNACPISPVLRPLSRWRPGELTPDMDVVSGLARKRWQKPTRPTLICRGVPQVAALFGSSLSQEESLSHPGRDLLLGSVLRHYHQKYSHCWSRWRGRPAGILWESPGKRPDALIEDEAGNPLHLIEVVGDYSPEQIERFHEECAERELSYELW